MAYLDNHQHDPQHRHKRLAGITGVALVHIALAAGLVFGLTIKGMIVEDGPDIETTFIEVPKPVPTTMPDPVPTETNSYTPPVATDTVIDLTENTPFETTIDFPDTVITELVVTRLPDVGPIARPDPVPVFTPRSPVPSNGPAGWVTNNDYPRVAITREYEGDVTYALEIDINGRPTACRVVSSSGHDSLDQATCRLIERRARFDPATDRSGNDVAGSYRGTVSWTIPEN